jgi:GT2 family glycosyltransferase
VQHGKNTDMIKGLTTAIVVGYHETPLSAHITMLSLSNITKYTDTEDYELILIEDMPKYNVRDDYHVLKIDKHIILDERATYSRKINLAAKEANGEYLAIIQNDVFVWEGWLKDLRYYLEKGLGEAIIPAQFPCSRASMIESYNMKLEEGLNKGARDACMIMITKEAFDKTGGFNEDLSILQEADFYERMSDAGVNQITTNKVQVSHLTLGTHYQDMEEFERKMHHDSQIRNEGVDPRSLSV